MKAKGAQIGPAVIPVRWLHGESPLRTYLAQRDQCLELYGRVGIVRSGDGPDGGRPEVNLGARRPGAMPAGTCGRSPVPARRDHAER